MRQATLRPDCPLGPMQVGGEYQANTKFPAFSASAPRPFVSLARRCVGAWAYTPVVFTSEMCWSHTESLRPQPWCGVSQGASAPHTIAHDQLAPFCDGCPRPSKHNQLAQLCDGCAWPLPTSVPYPHRRCLDVDVKQRPVFSAIITELKAMLEAWQQVGLLPCFDAAHAQQH